jgi:hypothetical protein
MKREGEEIFRTITGEDFARSIKAARSSENTVLKKIREKCPAYRGAKTNVRSAKST